MINTDELKRLRDLCDAAIPGPWKCLKEREGGTTYFVTDDPPDTPPWRVVCSGMYDRNARLITECRTAIPKLLDEIERLHKLLNRVYCHAMLRADSFAREVCKMLADECGKSTEQEEKHD